MKLCSLNCFVIISILQLLQTITAFIVQPIRFRADVSNRFILKSKLKYRNHDENDDASSMAVLKSRTAPSLNEIDLRPKLAIKKHRGINYSLLFSMFINQVFVVSLAISICAAYLYFTEDSQFLSDGLINWSGNVVEPILSQIEDPSMVIFRFLEGMAGSLPMILFGLKLETSDDRRFAKANFSTIFMVMTLFGRRSQVSTTALAQAEAYTGTMLPKTKFDRLEPLTKWTDVLLISMGISSITGISEEMAFRGILPHVLKSSICYGNVFQTLIVQAFVFGICHSSRPISGGDDYLTVPFIQSINGLWLGILYLLTGGDIVPCIVAHALYDFQIFFFTWVQANDQIEYAFRKCIDPIPIDSFEEVEQMKRELKANVKDDIFEMFKRVFYIMDLDKNGTISKSEAQKGISFLDIERILEAPSQKTVDTIFDQCIIVREARNVVVQPNLRNQLRFSDFIRLILTIKFVGDSMKIIDRR